MKSFDPKRFVGATISLGVSWHLGMVMESKGRQDFYEKQSPEVLRTLRELAIVESTESSNRIEGVTVEPGRLRPLVLGRARPRDRSEEEIVGYRNALNWIHTDPDAISVTPETIQRLHAIAQAGAGDAGQWKAGWLSRGTLREPGASDRGQQGELLRSPQALLGGMARGAARSRPLVVVFPRDLAVGLPGVGGAGGRRPGPAGGQDRNGPAGHPRLPRGICHLRRRARLPGGEPGYDPSCAPRPPGGEAYRLPGAGPQCPVAPNRVTTPVMG